jgi:hypothetical protein
VTDNPAIMARRAVVRLPGPDVLLRAIVGPHVRVAGDRVADVVSLAAVCPHELLDGVRVTLYSSSSSGRLCGEGLPAPVGSEYLVTV